MAVPTWTYVVEQNVTGSSESALRNTIARAARRIEAAVGVFLPLVGMDLGDDDARLVEPRVSSLISDFVGAVRTWRAQRDSEGLDTFSDFLADTI